MRQAVLWLCFALLAMPAWAQEETQEPESGEESVEEKIERLDQELRVLKRQAELDKEAAAEKAKATDQATAGRDGFSFRSADGAFQLRVRGYVQADYREFLGDDERPATDTFILRRVRPIFEGTLWKIFDFRLMPDFGGGTTVLQDAYIDLRLRPFAKVRVGKQKQPFGIERLLSASSLPFVERALPTAVAGNRDVGVVLYGDVMKDRLSYWAGVFNGVTDGASADADDGDGKDVVGRFMVHPFRGTGHERVEGLGAGFAASYGSQRGNLLLPGLATYRSSGQQVFFQYRTDATTAGTAVADGTRYRLSAQGYLYSGRLGVLAEQVFSSQEVRLDVTRDTLGANSWQVLGSWVLTGERASVNGVTPRDAFEPSSGKIGAFEVTARYHQLSTDSDAFPTFANPLVAARAAKAWAAGVNWYLNRSIKVTTNYEQTRFEGGAAVGDRPTEHDVLTRVQFGF
jgi:phosphate-selective porin OprO and OprP